MQAGRKRSLVRLWRETETANDVGAVSQTYTAEGRAWVEIREQRGGLRVTDAGEMPHGAMEVRASRYAGLAMEDVLEVVAGPEMGSTWRVVHLADDGKEVRGDLERWNGSLPT